MTVIGLVPPVQLLNVLPVTVRLTAVVESPSVFAIPFNVVAPVTVILEKLLLLWFTVAVEAAVLPFDVMTVTVPPAPVLLNAVTMELLLML